MSLADCKIITLPRVRDERGNLSYVEGENHIPFKIKRTYFLYDVPGGVERGSHAHRTLQQLMVAVSGSFTVELFDGRERREYLLNVAYQGLLMTPMIWRSLKQFSSGSVCLVMASDRFDEADYIRDYEQFIEMVRE